MKFKERMVNLKEKLPYHFTENTHVFQDKKITKVKFSILFGSTHYVY